jgi:hypothetical protein
MKKHSEIMAILFLLVFNSAVSAQVQYLPYSFRSYLKKDTTFYNGSTLLHTALKPYFLAVDTLQYTQGLLSAQNNQGTKRRWIHRKLFEEHLIEVSKEEYRVYADFIPGYSFGREFFNDRSTWMNTRGYQVGGTIQEKFSFYTSGFENQARFADYYAAYIDQHSVVPGQSYNRGYDQFEIPVTKDWSYVTALVSYTPVKYLNITLGHDKNFIGDGYRSLLLSDFSSPYTFLKLTANLGDVQYMAMWTGMQDPSARKLSEYAGNRKKGGVFHYLDWNVNKRLSIGFFDAVIWARTDDQGNRRGLEVDYINPVIFLRPLEGSSGSPDNAVIGLNAKYELAPGATIYGQFVLDDFVAKHFFSGDGFFRNKSGFQVGLRGGAPFRLKRLDYLLEFNSVRPFTYSEKDLSIINYAHYNEPLAHLLGANFREVIGMLNYNLGRFDISIQANYAKYGYDIGGINYGKNIFNLYNVNSMEMGNQIGQGLATNLYYGEGKVSVLINPITDLRIEASGIYRYEENAATASKTSWVTIGLASSFRNFYKDF